MASKDKSDRIISMVRGAFYVDVVARLDGKVKVMKFLKDHTDREIRDMVLDTKTPPLLGENAIEEAKKAETQEAPKQTVPTPPVVVKNRASRQDMIAALKAAGVAGVNVSNRNALEAAYAKLQGGAK